MVSTFQPTFSLCYFYSPTCRIHISDTFHRFQLLAFSISFWVSMSWPQWKKVINDIFATNVQWPSHTFSGVKPQKFSNLSFIKKMTFNSSNSFYQNNGENQRTSRRNGMKLYPDMLPKILDKLQSIRFLSGLAVLNTFNPHGFKYGRCQAKFFIHQKGQEDCDNDEERKTLKFYLKKINEHSVHA